MAGNSASPFDSLLAQSGELFNDRVSDSVAGMLDKIEETLTTMIGETQNAETQELYRKTRDNTLAHRADFEKHFRARFGKEFQQRSNRAKKISQSLSDIDLSSLELELVGEDDLQETLKFNDMATKVGRFCDEELGALDQRAGVLLGDADLQPADNPFAPQVICDAYKQACKQVDSEVAVRLVLLKLFDDHILDTLRSVYKDINALLVKNSILPKIRFSVSKRAGGEGGKAPEVEKDAPAAGEKEKAAPPTEQDFFTMMQNLIKATGNMPAMPAAGPGGQVVVLQGAELLSSLNRLQHGGGGEGEGALPVIRTGADVGTTNVLRELKDTSVGSSLQQMDAMTLDIVAMIFDQLFDEPKIPLAVKGLLGRMQIPMLKVAIADKAFFSSKAHPARKMVDALGEIAIRLPANFNSESALFKSMEKIVEELLAGFTENLEIFDATREKFSALIAEEDKRLEQETQATAKRLKEAEDLALAKTVSQYEIRERLKGRVGKVPRFVVDFLVQHWIKFLLLVHVKRGKESDAWKASLEIMDQLIWSVEPKETQEERKKLATVVPVMIKRLTASLKGAGTEQAPVNRFLDDLMKRHTEIVAEALAAAPQPAPTLPPRGFAAKAKSEWTTVGGGPAAKQPVTPAAAAKGESKPPAKAPAAPAVEEAELDFTTDLVVKNPFGGGEVKVEQLDFTDLPFATPTQARAAAKDASLTDHLIVGAWIEVREKNADEKITTRAARLSFVSAMKTSFLFFDRNGTTVLECSRAELARRYRLKEVADMDEAPLFDRIMSGLVGKMKAAPQAKAPG